MQKWQPLYVPLVGGIDDQNTDIDGAKPGITDAENVDFSRRGEVRGRPGMTKQDVFGLRTYNTSFGVGPADSGTFTLAALGYKPQALGRHRDRMGERPVLVALGRTWTWEGDRWADRLYGGAARVDRLADLAVPAATIDTGGVASYRDPQYGVADTFMINGPLAVSPMLGTGGAIETYLPGIVANGTYGVGTVITSGGVKYHCYVGMDGTNNNLYLSIRLDNQHAIQRYLLAGDAAIPVGLGDSPVCCAGDNGLLYVAFAGNGKFLSVLRVTVNGTVTARQDITVGTTVKGLWLAARTLDTSILLAYTLAGVAGVTLQPLEPTIAVTPPAPTTFDPGAAYAASGPVVVGPALNAGKNYWVAYTRRLNPATDPASATDVQARDLVIGRALVNVNGTVTPSIIKTYAGVALVAGVNLAWGLTHQPITVSGRTILGVIAGVGIPQNLTANSQVPGTLRGATWYELDITDLVAYGTGPFAGGTDQPGILAKGPTGGTDYRSMNTPAGATVNGNAWRFATTNYRFFNAAGGASPVTAINQCSILAPRMATAGRGTVYSGSVPHAMAGSQVAELGYPFLGAPEAQASFQAGAGFPITAGSYTVQCVWTWFDDAGQRHRSAPSLPQTITANGTTHTLLAVQGTACQITERTTLPQLEIYCTKANPPALAPKYLVGTFSTSGTFNELMSGTISMPLNTTSLTREPVGTEEVLYTVGGVFANNAVSGDGGCAALGKRLWLSDGKAAYASKILRDNGQGPAFNGEGVIQVNPPATAGRIVALEALDDKLVILCERGIYVTEGTGPDDAGNGQDFLYPVKVSDLGVAGPRSSVLTDKGVVFHANNTAANTDGATGGLWIVVGNMSVQPVGTKVQDQVAGSPLDLTYVPERQLLVGTAGALNPGKLITWDMRANEWSRWTTPEGFSYSVGEAAGLLWTCGTYPAVFDRAAGQDMLGVLTDYTMFVITNQMYANAQGGTGWGRVRNLVPLGELATHYLTMSVLYDMAEPWVSKGFNLVAVPGTTIVWPSDRYAPEWRLPRQKCSQLQVKLSATPATGAWASLRMDVQPRKVAPSRFRQ